MLIEFQMNFFLNLTIQIIDIIPIIIILPWSDIY